jgi:prepilin-type N-terminal cleavage/methylation domain-containing protein
MKRAGKNIPIYRRAGFALIELIGALAILAIGLPAIAYTFAVSLKTDSTSNSGLQAHFLANALINEISQRRFRESAAAPASGPEAGEVSGYDRRLFDDISDYNIFQTNWGALSPPRDETGAELANFANFTQYVDVININPPGAAAANRSFASVSDGSTDFKLVTVTITWEQGRKSVRQSKVFALNP